MSSYNVYFGTDTGAGGTLGVFPAAQINRITLPISATQWTYLSGADQQLATTSDVGFSSVATDTITEQSTDTGVTIDSLLIQDGNIASTTEGTGMKIATWGTTYGIGHQSFKMEFISASSALDFYFGYGTSGDLTNSMVIDNGDRAVKVDNIVELTGDNGVTIEGMSLIDSTIRNATNIQDMKMTGHSTWTGTGDYWSNVTTTFTLLRGGTGLIQSNPISFAGSQDVTVVANTANYVYIDSSGILQVTDTPSSTLYANNIVLFEVLWDGSAIFVKKENHPCCFQTAISSYLHNVAGNVFGNSSQIEASATVGAIKSTGTDTLYDHGLSTDIAPTDPISVSYFYTNGAGKWILHATTTTVPQVYNNAGTITALSSATKRGVHRIYGVCDNLNTANTIQWMGVINTAEFANLGTAQTAIAAGNIAASSNELAALELSQMGYVIVSNSVVEEVIIEKTTFNTRYVGGSTASSHLLLSDKDAGQYLDGGHTKLVTVTTSASSAPTVNEDTDNYKVGALWVKLDTDDLYINTDNTNGAAVWHQLARESTDVTLGKITSDNTFGMKVGTYLATNGIGAQSNSMEFIVADNTVDYVFGDGSSGGLTQAMYLDTSEKLLKIDKITELTGAAGVTIEGVLLKDSEIGSYLDAAHAFNLGGAAQANLCGLAYSHSAGEYSTAATQGDITLRAVDTKRIWLTTNGVGRCMVTNGGFYTDTISELSSDTGVTIDGLLIKDGNIASTNSSPGTGMKIATYGTTYGIGHQTNKMQFISGDVAVDFIFGVGTSGSLTSSAEIDNGTKTLKVDLINELTDVGVTIEGVKIEASAVATNLAKLALGSAGAISSTVDGDFSVFGGSTGSGGNNICIGVDAGDALAVSTSDANYNILIGNEAGTDMTTGYYNICTGPFAGLNITTGNENICIGHSAASLLTTGSKNVIIGEIAEVSGTAAANQVAIGYQATCTADNQIVIGNASHTEIRVKGVAANAGPIGKPVYIDTATGKLYYDSS